DGAAHAQREKLSTINAKNIVKLCRIETLYRLRDFVTICHCRGFLCARQRKHLNNVKKRKILGGSGAACRRGVAKDRARAAAFGVSKKQIKNAPRHNVRQGVLITRTEL